ncbi:MAG: cytochrome C [Deltaproteobacteria bacterium]|nr:MAG: cytochrome C [Deltaproteobacteria bacterium]
MRRLPVTNKLKWSASAIAVTIALVFMASGIYAGEFPETIKMDNPAYAKHKKGIVIFSHAKHSREYKASCGECHHDENNKPLASLKEGDDVKGCIECHKIPGEVPKKLKKKWKKAKLDKAEKKKKKLAYHAEAMHYNCRGCHKAFNKKNKTKKAPTTCKKCHPKKK